MYPHSHPHRLLAALFIGLVLHCADARAGIIVSSTASEGVTAGYSSMTIDFYSADEGEDKEFRPGTGMEGVVLDGVDQAGSGGILLSALSLWSLSLEGFISLADDEPREVTLKVESPPS